MFDSETKILIVDDVPAQRNALIQACKSLKFSSFVLAADGEEAWTILSQASSNIGLVICDWNMPGFSGLELAKRIRADARLKSLPFVLATVSAKGPEVLRALDVGVDNFIVKPFPLPLFHKKMEETFRRAQSRA